MSGRQGFCSSRLARRFSQLCQLFVALASAGRHVVLTGANGSGKTNLLEALSFLSPGRGLRRVAYPEIMREGTASGSWAVSVSRWTRPYRSGETGHRPATGTRMAPCSGKIRVNGATGPQRREPCQIISP